MSINTAIMAAVRARPDGITAKQIALLFRWTPTVASLRLGRLFFSGDLDRENVAPPHPGKQYLYWVRLPKIASPSVVEERDLSIAPQQEQRGSQSNLSNPPAADVESPSVASQPAEVE